MIYFHLFITIFMFTTFLFPSFAQEEASDEYIVKIAYFLPNDEFIIMPNTTYYLVLITNKIGKYNYNRMENVGTTRLLAAKQH